MPIKIESQVNGPYPGGGRMITYFIDDVDKCLDVAPLETADHTRYVPA
jgi:hypothetical protein